MLELGIEKMIFFDCNDCKKPYFGGMKECHQLNPEDLKVEKRNCDNCSKNAALKDCATHGKEFVVYKCIYCCS